MALRSRVFSQHTAIRGVARCLWDRSADDMHVRDVDDGIVCSIDECFAEMLALLPSRAFGYG